MAKSKTKTQSADGVEVTTEAATAQEAAAEQVQALVQQCTENGSIETLRDIVVMGMDAFASGGEDSGEDEEEAWSASLEAHGDGPALWASAETFEDLGELFARWIGGDIKYCPGYGDEEVGEETGPLTAVLSALNRAGFITTDSQPGELDGAWRQRAYVSGFALEPVARRIAKLGLCTDLVAVVKRPGDESGYICPLTVDGFHPSSWAITESAEEFAEQIGGNAEHILAEAWSVCLFDPAWGRQEYLWDHLAQELCYDVTPADRVLETDFVA